MRICAATVDEIEIICRIDRLVVGNDSRRGYLTHAVLEGKCFVATAEEGTPTGFIIFDTAFFETAFIWLVVVHPDCRRAGIATALIQHVELICPTDKLFTSTNESNASMRLLCDRLGFVKSGVIENLDDGDPEMVFFKRIK